MGLSFNSNSTVVYYLIASNLVLVIDFISIIYCHYTLESLTLKPHLKQVKYFHWFAVFRKQLQGRTLAESSAEKRIRLTRQTTL